MIKPRRADGSWGGAEQSRGGGGGSHGGGKQEAEGKGGGKWGARTGGKRVSVRGRGRRQAIEGLVDVLRSWDSVLKTLIDCGVCV